MRTVYSYIRLVLASWMFLGGIALQFIPSNGAVIREAHRREQLIQAIPIDQRAEWTRTQDIEDSQSEAYLRLWGILLGGIGFAIALFETAYICARYSRHCPFDTPK